MKKYFNGFVVSISFLFFVVPFSLFAETKNIMYQETIGKETNEVQVLYRESNGISIEEYLSKKVYRTVEFDSNQTIKMEYKDGNQKTTAIVQGNKIVLINKNKESIINLRKKIWIQSFIFGFQGFILSDQNNIVFETIRPGDFKLFEMKMTKQGEEQLNLPVGNVDTIKVRVQLTGLLAHFWSAEYWYRKSDGCMVKYKGVNGPPGTPETILFMCKEL